MKGPDKQLTNKIDNATIRYQSDILNRLRLYVFAKSAISSYCENRFLKLEGYNFSGFKERFKLVDFQKDKEIKSINHKEMVVTGNNIIGNELADSVFVLNAATFENWLFRVLKQKYLSSKEDIYSDFGKKKSSDDYGHIDIEMIKEAMSLEELWEKIIEKYLRGLPYDGIQKMMLRLLKVYKVDKAKITPTIIGRINEIFLCRNAIVHNQKIIGEDYINKSGQYAKYNKEDIISVSEEMLFEQADNLLRFMQDIRKNL